MGRDEPPGDEDRSGPDSGNTQQRYLFTVDGENTEAVLPLVCDIVSEARGELVIGNPVVLPEQTPLSAPGPRSQGDRQAAKITFKAKQLCQGTLSVEKSVMSGHNREHVVQQLVKQNDISTVITENQPPSGLGSLLDANGVDDSSLEDYCDTIIVTRTNRTEDIDSVLVPIARGPHSGMAIDVGLALARQNDANLELLHVYPTGDDNKKAEGKAVLKYGVDRIESTTDVESTLCEAKAVDEAIIDYTEKFDVTILGAPREGLIRQFVLGTIPDTVSARADGTVLVAHRGNVDQSWMDQLV